MGLLTKQAQACGRYSAPELQKLLTEQCSSSLQQRQENAQELIASTQAVLDKQGAAWKAACAAIGQLLTELSEAHDRHKQGHMALTTGITKSLQMTKQVLKVTLKLRFVLRCAVYALPNVCVTVFKYILIVVLCCCA